MRGVFDLLREELKREAETGFMTPEEKLADIRRMLRREDPPETSRPETQED